MQREDISFIKEHLINIEKMLGHILDRIEKQQEEKEILAMIHLSQQSLHDFLQAEDDLYSINDLKKIYSHER